MNGRNHSLKTKALARELYVSGECATLKEVGRRLNINEGTIGNWSCEEKWGTARDAVMYKRYKAGEKPPVSVATIKRYSGLVLDRPKINFSELSPEEKERALNWLPRKRAREAAAKMRNEFRQQIVRIEKAVRSIRKPTRYFTV